MSGVGTTLGCLFQWVMARADIPRRSAKASLVMRRASRSFPARAPVQLPTTFTPISSRRIRSGEDVRDERRTAACPLHGGKRNGG